MVRNVLGTILAIVGAAAAVSSPYQAWYAGRHGSTYRFDEIFSHVTAARSSAYGSMLIPLAGAALVTLIGLLLRSRLVVGLAGLIVLGFTILWMVQQGRAAGELVISTKGIGLGQGVADALGGGVLLIIAAVVLSGRSKAGAAVPAQLVDAPPEHQPFAAPTSQPSYESQPSYQPQSYHQPPSYEQPTYEQLPYEPPHAELYERPAHEPTAAPATGKTPTEPVEAPKEPIGPPVEQTEPPKA